MNYRKGKRSIVYKPIGIDSGFVIDADDGRPVAKAIPIPTTTVKVAVYHAMVTSSS